MADASKAGISAIMGLLQGATEFLPVSSSGHLVLFGLLFDVPDVSLGFIVLLHAGTLLATVVVLRQDLLQLAARTLRGLGRPSELAGSEEGRLLGGLGVATVITAALGLLLEPWLEQWSRLGWVVGLGFLASAALLWTTRFTGMGERHVLPLGSAALVGLAQAAATVPGLSRSGTTIACAMALGMTPAAAFRFSFLLSIPVIAGATLLELVKAPAWTETSATSATVGTVVAVISGYAALRLLRRLVTRGHLWMFSLYLVPLGSVLILTAWLGTFGR